MTTHDALLSTTLNYARRSCLSRYQTGAVLVSNGVVVSTGWSHVGMRLHECYAIHAEMHALMRARHIDLTGATCVIAAYRTHSERIVPSKPCHTCAHALSKAGILDVLYYDDAGEAIALNLDPMPSDLKRYRKPANVNA